jgi:hypothetical protein
MGMGDRPRNKKVVRGTGGFAKCGTVRLPSVSVYDFLFFIFYFLFFIFYFLFFWGFCYVGKRAKWVGSCIFFSFFLFFFFFKSKDCLIWDEMGWNELVMGYGGLLLLLLLLL